MIGKAISLPSALMLVAESHSEQPRALCGWGSSGENGKLGAVRGCVCPQRASPGAAAGAAGRFSGPLSRPVPSRPIPSRPIPPCWRLGSEQLFTTQCDYKADNKKKSQVAPDSDALGLGWLTAAEGLPAPGSSRPLPALESRLLSASVTEVGQDLWTWCPLPPAEENTESVGDCFLRSGEKHGRRAWALGDTAVADGSCCGAGEGAGGAVVPSPSKQKKRWEGGGGTAR